MRIPNPARIIMISTITTITQDLAIVAIMAINTNQP